MSQINKSASSSSGSAATSKTSVKSAPAAEPKISKFSNNHFAPLFTPKSRVYNRTAPALFIPKGNIKKNSNIHVAGTPSSSSGLPSMTRSDIITTRQATDATVAAKPASPKGKGKARAQTPPPCPSTS